MTKNSVPNELGLVDVLSRIADAMEKPAASPWLTKIEAYQYLRVSPKTFQRMIDRGAVQSHSLYEVGISRELFNKAELDAAIKNL
jgi:hypothetical protein